MADDKKRLHDDAESVAQQILPIAFEHAMHAVAPEDRGYWWSVFLGNVYAVMAVTTGVEPAIQVINYMGTPGMLDQMRLAEEDAKRERGNG